ncbi:MAG: helix-turn-helix domain-containing protein [Sphingomonas sp.]
MTALDFRLTGLGPGSTLAEQLRNRRLKRSLSLAQVAARSGLSRGTVANIERGASAAV